MSSNDRRTGPVGGDDAIVATGRRARPARPQNSTRLPDADDSGSIAVVGDDSAGSDDVDVASPMTDVSTVVSEPTESKHPIDNGVANGAIDTAAQATVNGAAKDRAAKRRPQNGSSRSGGNGRQRASGNGAHSAPTVLDPGLIVAPRARTDRSPSGRPAAEPVTDDLHADPQVVPIAADEAVDHAPVGGAHDGDGADHAPMDDRPPVDLDDAGVDSAAFSSAAVETAPVETGPVETAAAETARVDTMDAGTDDAPSLDEGASASAPDDMPAGEYVVARPRGRMDAVSGFLRRLTQPRSGVEQPSADHTGSDLNPSPGGTGTSIGDPVGSPLPAPLAPPQAGVPAALPATLPAATLEAAPVVAGPGLVDVGPDVEIEAAAPASPAVRTRVAPSLLQPDLPDFPLPTRVIQTIPTVDLRRLNLPHDPELDHDLDDPVVVPTVKRTVRSTATTGRRRPRVRRVTRVVRHVDPWSVFKVALCFSAVLYGVCLTAGVLLWNVAYTTGTLDNMERFFESFGWDTFEFKGGELYHNAWIAGLFAAVGLTGFIVIAATLFNLITDLVGGIRVTVLEEEVVERDPSERRPVLRTRRPKAVPIVDPYDPDAPLAADEETSATVARAAHPEPTRNLLR